ncbi:MAG TPA: HAMP domain-containing sensor histidine kinase [Ktedonobacterales bacterium]|nr:HAMP domain-containing sensor histidine kinase [Ktedonobacterales bacterium]
MKDVPFVLRAERQIYAEYDRDRRLRLSKFIAPTFATILTALLLASLIVPQQFHGTRSNSGLIILCDALFLLGAYAAWRKWVNIATGSILLAALLIMVLSVLVNQPFILSDLFTVPAVVIIGLSALIGLPWMILATTLLTTAFVFILSGSPSLSHDLANPNNVNSIGAFIIEQWVLAIIVFGAATGYRRILRQISDVRVQYERARQLDDLKDQFITSVNHELRNPVMLMQGYVELLRIKGGELPPERRDEMVQRASKAGDNLAQLVQSILDTRRIDQSAADFQPEAVPLFDAVATAASLVDPGEGPKVERDLRVHVPEGLAVWGERVRVQQILTNLLSNAIKYSAPGTAVEITAHVAPETSSWTERWRHAQRTEQRMVEIVVRDYGLGIPPDQAALLFHRFVRLPRDLASSTIGNGLGLYLCRELTEAMGGRIWVESTGVEGEGSAFHIVLPAPPAAPVLAHRVSAPLQAGPSDQGGSNA